MKLNGMIFEKHQLQLLASNLSLINFIHASLSWDYQWDYYGTMQY